MVEHEATTEDLKEFLPKLAAKLAELMVKECADDVFAETDEADAEHEAQTEPKEPNTKDETIESNRRLRARVGNQAI